MVKQQHLHPEDHYEITALLESNGWTDQRVQQQFGFENVFELARQLWSLGHEGLAFRTNDYVELEPLWSRLGEYFRQFMRGMVFALPMALSVASMVVLQFSLWSYQYLSVKTATAIAIGTILSFWTVGGFMQAIARRGFFYIFQGYYRLAKETTFRYIVGGIVTSVVVSLAMYLLNILFPVFPVEMIYIIVLYYFVLNAIWLSVTAMYILKREFIFTGLILLGIAMVYVGFVRLHINILEAQLIAMVVLAILSLLIVWFLFRREESTKDVGINPSPPRPGFTFYTILPYFAYGFLYYGLLFIDRIMAWSTNSPYTQYFIWFRGDYEVGLDFALLTLVIPMGVSEIIVYRIMNGSLYHQRQFLGRQAEEMNQLYLSKYFRSLYVMLGVAVSSAVLVYITVKWLMDHYLLGQNAEILQTVNSNYVFIVGLAAYAVLSVALLNSVMMFSLSRPDLVLKPLLIALAVDLVSGFLLTRWIDYTDAVWGLALGSLTFSVLTIQNVRKVLLTLDYHLYLLS